jgi:hypothetical protein
MGRPPTLLGLSDAPITATEEGAKTALQEAGMDESPE